MKKIFISLIALAATSLTGFADTSLAEAYKALSGMKGMTEKSVASVAVDGKNAIRNVKTASVNASQGSVQDYRDSFIYMMENLPIRNMVIGANNMRELATVYSTPAGGGMYDILVIKGNTYDGNFSVSFGQTNGAGVKAIRNCELIMDAGELVMTPQQGDSNASFITMTD